MPVHSLFLKYFHEVCETGSMRLAAKNLGVVPSALSRKINDIEKELGTPLFLRSISGVTLTPAGKLMRQHVGETLQSFKTFKDGLDKLNNDDVRQVCIAGPQSVIPTFLPSIMSEFHSMHSDVVTVFKGTSDICVDKLLKDDRMDVVLGFDLEPPFGGAEVSRCQLDVGAIVSSNHPLANRELTTLAECLKYKLVLPDAVWPLRKRLDSAIEAESAQPDIVATSDSLEFIKTSIREESCIGFATRLGFDLELLKKDFCFIPLNNSKTLIQEFVLIVKEELSFTSSGRDLVMLLTAQLEKYKASHQ